MAMKPGVGHVQRGIKPFAKNTFGGSLPYLSGFGCDETGCVPGIDGKEVRAETMVPDVKECISESIDNPEVLCDPETWDRPGFALVLSWLAQKWLQKCRKLAPRGNKNPEQYLTKEQQKACLDSAAAELIREITQQRPLN